MEEFDEILNKENIFIKNIRTVYQFSFKKPNKILTIFGEGHNEIIDCHGYSITIADYIKYTLKVNKKIKIFLEYDAGINYKTIIDSIGSFNIQEIIKTLDSMKLIDKIIPVDCRNYYLKTHYHHILYSSTHLNTNYDFILHNYIEPFLIIKFEMEAARHQIMEDRIIK